MTRQQSQKNEQVPLSGSGGPSAVRNQSRVALNIQQVDVTEIEGDLPLKVIAGAGTGKTETLAARFVALVRAGVPPHRILLLTFTEEAAVEMRARVMLRLREHAPDIPSEQLIDLWCHTFHSFGVRLVREYGWALRLPPAPRVLDAADQQQAMDDIVMQWENAQHHAGFRPLDHASYRWDNGEAWNRALDILHTIRDSSATPADLGPHPALQDQQNARFAAQRAQLTPLIEQSYGAFEAYLRDTGTLDFPALIDAAARLLATVPAVRDRFAVVMIDEFQDTNPAQLNLLTHLRPDWSATTVVGDPRQAIFGWRSAHPDSLRQFPYGPDRPYADRPLSENYRSHAAICAVANLALAGSELAREVPLVAGRTSEAAHPALLAAPPVSLLVMPSVEAEAAFVAAQTRQLLDQGVRPTSIALLLRARTRLRVFTDALLTVGVPFRISGGAGFYRQPVVRLLASLLHLLQDPEDSTAAAHIWEHPALGMGYWGLEVWETRHDDPVGVRAAHGWWRWLIEPELVPASVPERADVVAKFAPFAALYRAARARAMLTEPSEFLMWLYDASGLHAWYAAHDDTQAVRDVRKLVALADEWHAADRTMTVATYTQRLRARVLGLVPKADAEPVPLETAVDAVEISTVHGAKGREWPVVFLAETSLPSRRSRNVDHVLWDVQWKMVISDGKTSGAKGAPDPLADLRRDLRRRARNEERAIWYVALTRARDRLIVTHSGCALDDADHFGDVSITPEGMHSEEDVHFFHELWELVRANPDVLAETVVVRDDDDRPTTNDERRTDDVE